MASYELKIDLVGAADAEAILKNLQGLSTSLGKPSSIFSGGSSSASPIAKQADDLTRVVTQANRGQVAMAALNKEFKGLQQVFGKNSTVGEWFAAWKTDPNKTAAFGKPLTQFERVRSFFKENPDQKTPWMRFRKLEREQNNPVVPDASSTPKPGRIRLSLDDIKKNQQAKSDKDMVSFKKDMSFLMMPLFNPGSMWATLFSGRQTYSAMNTATGKAFRDSKMGGMGAGAATGLLVAGATAAGLVLKALTKTVQETTAAYEHARQIYAKALTGGMGLQFTVKRGMLASIMGVSEQDVFRFGAQMAYLNPKLEWASKILADTATPLTKTSWEFKVLGTNLSALFSKIAVEVAPTLNEFAREVSEFVKRLATHSHEISKFLGGASNPAERRKELDKDFWDNHSDLMEKMSGSKMTDSVGTYIEKFKKEFAGRSVAATEMIGKQSGLTTAQAAMVAKWTHEGLPQGNKSDMPSPQAWMKQLPASHLEKMGLQVMGGGTNYQKDISHNTKEIAAGIKMLVSMNKNKPQSSSWDTSPLTANP